MGYRQSSASMSYNAEAMARSHEMVMNEQHRRHPEISPAIWRYSRSRFYAYLHDKSHKGGDYRRGFWGFPADPVISVHPPFYFGLRRITLLAFAAAFLPHVFGERSRWLRIRENCRRTTRHKISIASLESTRLAPQPNLSAWIRERRWESAVNRARHADPTTNDTGCKLREHERARDAGKNG